MKRYMKFSLLVVLLAVSSAAIADESVVLVESASDVITENAGEKFENVGLQDNAETPVEVSEQKAHWLNRAVEAVKTTITENPKKTAVIVGTVAVVTAFVATCPAAKNLLYRVMGWKKAKKNPRAVL